STGRDLRNTATPKIPGSCDEIPDRVCLEEKHRTRCTSAEGPESVCWGYMARLCSQRQLQSVHRHASKSSSKGMQAAGCGDYQLQSGGGAEDVESRRASVARQGVYADVVGATSAHSVAGEQGSTQAIPNRLVRAGVAIQGAHPALAAGRLVQSQHRNETEGGLPAPVGMGTACAGTGHARDQTDRVRVAGVGDQEQGSTCRCVERRCTTDHRRASRPASDLCVYLGEPEGPKASVLS